MNPNLLYAIGAILLMGGGLIGVTRAGRSVNYEPVYTKYSIYLGAVLLIVHAVFFMDWKTFSGL
jgi:hypothetical protein